MIDFFKKSELSSSEILAVEKEYNRDRWKTSISDVEWNGEVIGKELILWRKDAETDSWIRNHVWDIS